ncbi:PAS domain-containing protein [Hyalangium versicolor]|uniref:PAS domain-containing protein n=1 Tax=Hyalangium versicolor TaxID=2861190 RepID=UPI001CCD1FBC|nr:PAS domain-containing protein [Hyalangium versicolor]
MLQPRGQGGRPKPDEEGRLRALHRHLLNEEPDPEYDAIVQLAAAICEVPIALVTLVDRDQLRFKAQVGLSRIPQVERKDSFCSRVVEQDGLFLIEDTQADPRFQDHLSVRGEPHIRFYAGTPLHTEEGFRIGVLCIIDHVPRQLTAVQLRSLEQLGRQIETHFRLRLQLLQAHERNAELEQSRLRQLSLTETLEAEIQERQRVEQELRTQREVLSSVLSHIPHSVFWKDRSGTFLGCNDAFARRFGYASPRDLLGRTDHDFGLPLEQVQAFRRDDLEVMDSGRPKLDIEEPVRSKEGMDRWLLTSKVPLRNAEGMVTSVLGIFTDITERREQEAELQQALRKAEVYAARLESMVYEARARTRRLMEVSLDAVFVLDVDGRIVEANPVAQHLLGLEPETLVGRPFDSLAPEPEQLSLRKALAQLRPHGTMRLDDQGLLTAKGNRLAVQLLGSVQDEGEFLRLLIVAHDLTERRRLEQQGIQNDRLAAMGVLAAGIAHEINNPTAYVLSNLDFLRQWRDDLEQHLASLPALPDPLKDGLAETRQILADCIDGCARIQDIVRGMRHLSHQGHPDEQMLIDVHTTLDSVLNISQGELKHTARLEKDYGPELPLILGSEGRLGQVFLNLIINAIQAMRPGVPRDNLLRVRTRADERHVRIDISDTGHGIPKEALPHIFDPFFTTKPAGVGTGLGLSISYAIIQKMGGEMRVETQVGKGTTFFLLLPIHEPA